MATTEPYFNLVKTGASSWTAVLMLDGKPVAHATSRINRSAEPVPSAARFPHLAIVLVALAIFAASMTAGFEYLQQTFSFLK